MAKLVVMLIFLIAVALALVIYIGPDATNYPLRNNVLFLFITNSTGWSSTQILTDLIGVAATVGLAGIIAGSVFGFKTDFLLLSTMVGGLLLIGSILISLNVVFTSQMASIFGCTDLTTCDPANWVTWIVIAPIAFLYVWTVLEWWRTPSGN
jgi:hypothetical protein